MNLLDFLLSWTSVLLIVLLAVGLKWSALRLSIAGLFYTSFLSSLWFKTSFKVVGLSALDGIVTALPVILVVFFAIFLSTLLLETGGLAKIAAWFLAGIKEFWARTLLISAGLGNFLEGSGVVAEPVVAPILTSYGMAPPAAAALSIQGYAGLFSLELAGAIMALLAVVTGLDFFRLSLEAALLSFVPTFFLIFTIPWFLGQPRALRERFPLFLFCGIVLNTVTLAMVFLQGAPVSAMTGGLAFVVLILSFHKGSWGGFQEILQPASPFLLVIICLFVVNLISPVRGFARQAFELSISLVPSHRLVLHPFFDAYSYIFLALALGLFVIRPNPAQLRAVMKKGSYAVLVTVSSMALFGAMGQVVAYSGYNSDLTSLAQERNMAYILANGLSNYTGKFYPLFAPLLGWVGTVLTGYGMASVLLLGKLQVTIAELSGTSPTLLAAGLAVGGGVGSISSPFKLAVAGAVCGALGQEGIVLRKTIPLGIVAALLVGAVSMLISLWR